MMANWSPEYRLKLIQALAAISHAKAITPEQKDTMQRIAFLCDMPDSFLEANKSNYEDVIRLVEADMVKLDL